MPLFLNTARSNRSLARHLALALAFVVMLAVELFGLHALETTEARLADVYTRRHAVEYLPDPDLVIVDIDDASMTAMQEIAGLWTWPREIHADLLEALADFKPRAIVFDIMFSERDLKRPKSDQRLSDAIAAHPQVYLPAIRLSPAFDASGEDVRALASAFGLAPNAGKDRVAIQLPHAIDRTAWRLGLINSIEDEDGVMRRYRLVTESHGMRLPSLPARVAGDLGARLPAGDEFMMRWPEKGHQRYAYSELYRVLTEKRYSLSAADLSTLESLFRDKLIVIGTSAAATFDHHLTPLDAGYPGVDILAVAIDNLKNERSVAVAHSQWSLALGIVLIAALCAGFVLRLNPIGIGSFLIAASLASLWLADAAMVRSLLIQVATPLVFAWVFFLFAAVAGYLRERRASEQAVSLFGRFLNPNVVHQIVEQGETVSSLSGRTREITVLFSDIRGFTALSETRPPNEVVDLLNRYFERQVEVVFRHGGTLDKFIGDCIMAFWGAPLDDPEHGKRAVAAALEMQEALLDFKRELAATGSDIAHFDAGIGVHTGPAVVGFIGAQRKLDYTAIGDTVNLASRVEGLTRGVARILVTQDTMQACAGHEGIAFQYHGAFAVKGRAGEVDLYEPRRIS